MRVPSHADHEPALAIAPLSGPPRERLETARAVRARGVVLDATLPGLRPRELDRSARRGLCALLRRLELRLAGLDLPIPAAHFTDPATQDRAVSAVSQACAFLAEAAALAETTPILHLAAPDPHAAAAAADLGVALTAPPPAEPPAELPEPFTTSIDLAELILADQDPLKAIAETPEVGAIRLSDAARGVRQPLGAGELDVFGARAVTITAAAAAELIIDVRDLPDARAAAERSLEAWADAARSPF